MTLELFDPSRLSYEVWLRYFFDRPIVAIGAEGDVWREETALVEVEDKARLLGYLKRFNTDFTLISKRFSMAQIDQGLWGLYGGGVHAGSLLTSAEIPLDSRLNAIESLEHLYRQAVKGWTGDIKNAEPGGIFWMLWDLIVEWMGIENAHSQTDLDPILERCAETLGRILNLDDTACEVCALHGLGHLKTSSARTFIRRYLDQHPDLPDAERAWIESCYRGQMQ